VSSLVVDDETGPE